MSILYGISIIALCSTSFFYGAEGQATCSLSWDNGTQVSDTEWSFGFTLDPIKDTTEVGNVILNMKADNITAIKTTTVDNESGSTFMIPTLEDGRFFVTLTNYFTQYEELETSTTMRIYVTFTCSVNTRTLELAQPITDTNNHYPEFQNAPYSYELPMPFPSGFSVELFGTISAKDIDLTNTNISFTLNSSDPNANGFSASWLSRDTTDTKLHYAQLLTTSLLSIEKDVTFQIYATDNGVPSLTSSTNIIISVDEENSTPHSPVFTYPVYIADHSALTIEEASGTLILFNQGSVSLSEGISSEVEFTIANNIGSYEDNFWITISDDYSYISITLQNVTEALLAEKYVILTLTATRSGAANTGITILHIDLPGITSCDTTTISDFTTVEQTTQYVTMTTGSTGTTESYTESPTVTTEECICDCSTTVSSIIEDNSIATTSTVYEDTSAITDGDYTTNTPLATTDSDNSITTSVSDSMITTTVIGNTLTPTDSGSSVTTTIITPTLIFPSSIYRFDKDSTFTGVLMTQTAVATNAEGTIVYTVTFDDEYLTSRIIMDLYTAELTVTAAISPGIYTLQITAKIEELSLSATTTVVLVISTLTDCSGEIAFGYALQIIELEEELAHENVLPLDDNGCSYTIYSQTPNQDLFSINGTYLNAVAIDREASYFSEMSIAQVRVIIDASCTNDTETNNESKTTRSKRDTEYNVLTENIAYKRTRTVLVVIINDINDNAPIWSSKTPSYIGFPSYELTQLLLVPYVYQFSATDADIGENAIVTYTLPSGSDDVFYIHSTQGTLYTQQGVYIEDDLELTISATDGVFETLTKVIVKPLESYNVVVLFITGGVLEDVEDIVEDLSTSTGYWIRSLGSAVISESDISNTRSLKSVSSRARRASDTNTLLRLVVYGLENNKPVGSETLVSELQAVELIWAISDSATLESFVFETNALTTTSDTRGYLAAVIVLSILLFLMIIAAGVVYFLFFRPRNSTSIESKVTYENFDNRVSNGSIGAQQVKSVTLGESQDDTLEYTDLPNADWISKEMKNTENSFFENSYAFDPLKRDNYGNVIFIPPKESLTDVLPDRPKRKSVAFKTTVQEIEIARL